MNNIYIHPYPSPFVRPQRGLSLVEILVALTISLFLVAGVIQLFVGSKQTYRFHDGLSRIQENGRFALEVLSRDIRMTGFTGCPPTNTVVNVLNNPTDWWKNFGPGSLVGYEGTVSFPGSAFGTSSGARINGTDAAVFLGGNGGYFITASAPSATPPTFTLNRPGRPNGGLLGLGDIVIVCDAQRTSIFQVTGVNPNPPVGTQPVTIAHAAGALTPGNSTANLFPSGVVDSYVPAESTMVDFVPSAFYVGVSNSGNSRSLYRLQPQVTNAGVTSMVAQELVEGVERMEIRYGVCTGTGTDRRVNPPYVNADSVANWADVCSVRIDLLLASLEDNLVTTPQTVVFPADTGIPVTPGDRRLRQGFSTTVGIRNRLP